MIPHGDSFQSPRKSNILWSGIRGSVPEHYVLLADEVVSVNRATADYCQEIAGPDRLTVRRAVS